MDLEGHPRKARSRLSDTRPRKQKPYILELHWWANNIGFLGPAPSVVCHPQRQKRSNCTAGLIHPAWSAGYAIPMRPNAETRIPKSSLFAYPFRKPHSIHAFAISCSLPWLSAGTGLSPVMAQSAGNQSSGSPCRNSRRSSRSMNGNANFPMPIIL